MGDPSEQRYAEADDASLMRNPVEDDATGRLRDEVAITRSTVIKIEHGLKQSMVEIRALAASQAKTAKRSLLGSMAAYVVFAALAWGLAHLAYTAKLAGFESERAKFKTTEARLEVKVAEAEAHLARWHQIERELLELGALVKAGDKEMALEKFTGLKRVKFAGLLEHLVSQFRDEVAEEKYRSGKGFFARGSFREARRAFEQCLEFDPEPAYAAELYYHIGMASLRLKDHRAAVEQLRLALEQRVPKSILGDARYHLAFAHDRLGERRTAKHLYLRFFKAHPKHRLAGRAERRYDFLKSR